MIDPTRYRSIKDSFLKEGGLPDTEVIEAVESELAVFVRKAAEECLVFCDENRVKYMLIPPVSGDRT